MGEMVPIKDGALVSDLDSDINFIYRNVKDLAKSAQCAYMKELDELFTLSYKNLKVHMGSDGPLAMDPSLSLECFKAMAGIVAQRLDNQRKAADTLIKARVFTDVPRGEKLRDALLDDEDLPEDEVVEASVGEGGVFGNLASGKGKSKDPDLSL